ncbi:MAG: hypothetical protein WCR72_11135 [Bacteroidota bacterium]
MNTHREYFEKYKNGELDEDKVDALLHNLVELYFRAPAALDQAEMEFAEDLVIELYAAGTLGDIYQQQFKIALSVNPGLNRKCLLLRELNENKESLKNPYLSRLRYSENPVSDEEEEEQLSQILLEVIEKVHVEDEKGLVKDKPGKLLLKMKAWLEGLIPEMHIAQPQVRMALVLASVLIIAGIVWVTVVPDKNKPIAYRSISDTNLNKPYSDKDSAQVKKVVPPPAIPNPVYASADSVKNRKVPEVQYAGKENAPDTSRSSTLYPDPALLAYAEDIPASIDYVQLRSVSSAANDSFIMAAEKYGNREYNSCLVIIERLLETKAFSSADTINELNFYAGIIYMKKGFDKPSYKALNKSMMCFSRIDSTSSYYNDSRWFAALSATRLGKDKKGIEILDALIEKGYQRAGEVKALKNSIVARKRD